MPRHWLLAILMAMAWMILVIGGNTVISTHRYFYNKPNGKFIQQDLLEQ